MLGYDFEIVYRPRCENKATDTLSRNPNFFEEIKVISTTMWKEEDELQQEIEGN